MREKAVDLVAFVVNQRPLGDPGLVTMQVVNHLALHVQCHKWGTILITYGIDFLLATLEYYKEREEFICCAEIVQSIEEHSEIIGIKLPTEYPEPVG